jgi:hypothetical protein
VSQEPQLFIIYTNLFRNSCCVIQIGSHYCPVLLKIPKDMSADTASDGDSSVYGKMTLKLCVHALWGPKKMIHKIIWLCYENV